MARRKNKLVLAFIIAVVVLYIVIYVIPGLNSALTPTYTVEYGELRVTDSVDACIVRNEQVYFSGKAGKANRYFKQGALVRRGSKVMDVSGKGGAKEKKFSDLRSSIKGEARISASDLKTKKEGILSYYADGYESRLTPDFMKKHNAEYYRKVRECDVIPLKRSTIAKGDPVFKIADRSLWYLVCYIPESSTSRYKVGSPVSAEISGTEIRGTIQSLKKEGDQQQLIIRTNYYLKGFAVKRSVPAKIITADNMGLLVYNSSISKKNGHKGVWVKQKTGDYKFVRIGIISTDGKKSVVYKSYFYDEKGKQITTLKSYDEVLRRGR